MNWLIYVLLVVAALFIAVAGILTAKRAFIDKPRDRRKLRSWRLGFAGSMIAAGAYVLLLFVTVIRFPSDSEKQTHTIVDSVHLSEQRIMDSVTALYQCTIDSLSKLNQARVAAPEDEAARYAELATEQAECAAAGEILKTALDSGIYFTGLSEYRQAVTHFNYAILAAQDDSSKAEVYVFKGISYQLWGSDLSRGGKEDSTRHLFELALNSYDSALACKRDLPGAWLDRGGVLGRLQRHEEALKSLDRALVYKRDFPEAWAMRATALKNLGWIEDALASYDSCFAYKREEPLAWYNRGNLLDSIGRDEEAIASYDSALRYRAYFPKVLISRTWNNRGAVLSDRHRYEEARASYDSSLTYNNEDPITWYNLCEVLDTLKSYEEALTSCNMALKYDPDLKVAQERRKSLLEKMRR